MALGIKHFYVQTDENLAKVRDYLSKANAVCLDFETSKRDPHTGVPWLCSIRAESGGHTYIVDVQRTDFSIMKDVIENRQVIMGGAEFDLRWLRKFWNIRPRDTYCVIITERVLSAGIRRGENDVESLSERYHGIQLNKQVRNSFVMDDGTVKWIMEDKANRLPIWTEEQIDYSGEDSDVLPGIKAQQMAKVISCGISGIVKIENRLCANTADMEYVGLNINVDKWRRNTAAAKADQTKLHTEICTLLSVGSIVRQSMFSDELGYSKYDINLNSPDEVKRLFLNAGIHVESTDEKVLKRVNHPAAPLLIQYSKLSTLISSYGDNWLDKINPVTGRIHASINQVEARSGRYSITKPPTQTVPNVPEYRECFEAEEGNLILGSDYAQIELCILADISKDRKMIDIMNSGGDIHTLTAMMLFDQPLEKCAKGAVDENGVPYPYRGWAKTINFAQIYGQGPDALAISLGIPIQEAKDFQFKYFNLFSGIKKYLIDAADKPFVTGYAETLLGRKRWFPIGNYSNRNAIPNDMAYVMRSTGKNHPIQGTSADMTKLAQICIADAIFERGDTKWREDVKNVNVVHDEILYEYPASQDYADFPAMVEDNMVKAGKYMLTRVPVKVEIHIGPCWSK